MKIISKYKDFYDYIVQDHDADITYVRHIGLVNEYLDDLFRKEGNSIPYYSKYYGYQNRYSRCFNGQLTFDNFIFGIYPFVYSQPIIRIHYNYLASNTDENIFLVLGHELTERILADNYNTAKGALEELISVAQVNFNQKLQKNICNKATVSFGKNMNVRDIQKSLRSYLWKTECTDIFYKIESPVFVKYDYDLFVNGAYWDNWPQEPKIGNLKNTHYITNISFQKLNYNILKYWIDDVFILNTYINIENFLWSIKQEPEANPDNKTKIIAHGFDLKTSFRKI